MAAYQLQSKLASGGFCEVWTAQLQRLPSSATHDDHDSSVLPSSSSSNSSTTSTLVAIKKLLDTNHPDHQPSHAEQPIQPKGLHHLLTEYKVLQQLHHPNIVSLVDALHIGDHHNDNQSPIIASPLKQDNNNNTEQSIRKSPQKRCLSNSARNEDDQVNEPSVQSQQDKENHSSVNQSDFINRQVHPSSPIKPESEMNSPHSDGPLPQINALALEFCPHGELWEHLRMTGRMDEILSRTIMIQLLSAVKYCRDQGVCHRDIKPEQIVFGPQFEAKLVDFGLASQFPPSSSSSSSPSNQFTFLSSARFGTREFHSPEIELGVGEYDVLKAEVWSCGLTLFFMLYGFPAFNHVSFRDRWFADFYHADRSNYWSRIKNYVEKTEFAPSNNITPEAEDLLKKMLSVDPAHRLSLDQIEEHDWFGGPTFNGEELQAHMKMRFQRLQEIKQKEIH